MFSWLLNNQRESRKRNTGAQFAMAPGANNPVPPDSLGPSSPSRATFRHTEDTARRLFMLVAAAGIAYIAYGIVYTKLFDASGAFGMFGTKTTPLRPTEGCPSAPRGSIKLAGFGKRGLDPMQFLLRSPDPPDKKLWFDKLRELGFGGGAGRPGAKRTLCLTASGGAELRTASCVAEKYDYVAFFGDSLNREAAWSFVRHAFEDDASQCPIGKRWRPTFENTEKMPCMRCPRPLGSNKRGSNVCGGDEPQMLSSEKQYWDCHEQLKQDCCKRFFISFTWVARASNFPKVVSEIQQLAKTCPCRGLFMLSVGLHEFYDDPNLETTWNFPVDRYPGVMSVLEPLQNLPNVTVHWSNVPSANHALMFMDPAKFRLNYFKQLLWIPQYAKVDRWITSNMNINLVPYYEISRYYEGLQCDGIHFGQPGEKFGCGDFQFVTDVVIQLWLAKICADKEHPDSWYRTGDEVLSDCSPWGDHFETDEFDVRTHDL